MIFKPPVGSWSLTSPLSQNSGKTNPGDSRVDIHGVTQHETGLRLGLMGFKCVCVRLEVQGGSRRVGLRRLKSSYCLEETFSFSLYSNFPQSARRAASEPHDSCIGISVFPERFIYSGSVRRVLSFTNTTLLHINKLQHVQGEAARWRLQQQTASAEQELHKGLTGTGPWLPVNYF